MFLKTITFFSLFLLLIVAPVCAQDESFLSTAPPADCGTTDQTIVQLPGMPGYACLKTMIFPQFAAGNGWTTQISGLLPVQPLTGGLVEGTRAGFGVIIYPGDSATVSRQTSCLGLWTADPEINEGIQELQGPVLSGGAGHIDFTGLAACPQGSSSLSVQAPGLGEGPMQLQVMAPNAQALREATTQLTYYYEALSWQVTVTPIDVRSAKTRWTAPLFQGGDYVTAFSVVNASPVAQSVTIALRDGEGGNVGAPVQTPILAAGCGCNQLNQSAPGGYYARTVPDLFGNITQTGSIEFTASQPIVVLVLRVIKSSLGSVPAI